LASSILREGGAVLWIDCGSRLYFPRLEQILANNEAPLDKLYITSPMDFNSQEAAVVNVVAYPPRDLRLIVCDDFTYLHRIVISGNPREDLPIYKRLAFQVALLKETCLSLGVSCILVGHVRDRPEKEGREPVASRILSYWADVIINFKRENQTTYITFDKPRDKGEYRLRVSDKGVEVLA